jgi:hypothetical protein
MFAWVDLPPLASVVSVLVVPLLAELADPVAYLGDKADGDRRPRQEMRHSQARMPASLVATPRPTGARSARSPGR